MEQPIAKDLTGIIVNKQFKLQKKLGSGAFGEIYLANNQSPSVKCSAKDVAIKIEKSDSKHPQIQFETKLYNYLNQHVNVGVEKGIPKIYGCTTEQGYNFMIMELLGKSLEDLFTTTNRTFSLKSVLLLGMQMLESVEFLHSKQFIHRDIKPDNFLMGGENKAHKVFMVDFGLAKRYISKEGHIPYKENKSLTGTARYASINTHLGIEQSRRDDLESLGYVLMYFLKGSLPWQNLRANNQKEKYERIMEKKLATSTEMLCKGLPDEFSQFMNYTKNLKFDEKPDYSYIRTLFRDVMTKSDFELTYVYDWDEPEGKKISFSLDSRKPNPEVDKEKEKEKEKEKQIRQISQPNSKELVQKTVGNYFNSSIIQNNGSILPNVVPQANGSAAKALIQQLQQHQKQIQNKSFQHSKRMYNPRTSNNSNQAALHSTSTNFVVNPQKIVNQPVKTSSMHSIHQAQAIAKQQQHSSVNSRQNVHSQNLLYKTLYPLKPQTQERQSRNRLSKKSNKFMISHKGSIPQTNQQSFHGQS